MNHRPDCAAGCDRFGDCDHAPWDHQFCTCASRDQQDRAASALTGQTTDHDTTGHGTMTEERHRIV